MGENRSYLPKGFFSQLCGVVLLLPLVSAAAKSNFSVSAVFTFGDSTIDSGNNNYILTTAKSDFPPYGRDFPEHRPTGRFCNGKLGADFFAADLGVKDKVPPYLDQSLTLEELTTGICFGSAGTGIDPLTAKMSGTIPIRAQLDLFREYLSRLDIAVGRERRENLVRNAVFLFSVGSNDFIMNYFALTTRRKEFSVQAYSSFLRQMQLQFLQEVESLGARRIAVFGLPPLGCLPYVVTLNPQERPNPLGCIASMNAVATTYNANLQRQLASHPASATIVYVDIYNPLIELLRRPLDFGFEETAKGCCGTGLLEFGPTCNLGSFTCPDASKFVFWDAVHPTEETYAFIARALRPTLARLVQQ